MDYYKRSGQPEETDTDKSVKYRLVYGNFHIIPHINPRHPYQPEDDGPRADMGVSG